jgi:hypothetical protein
MAIYFAILSFYYLMSTASKIGTTSFQDSKSKVSMVSVELFLIIFQEEDLFFAYSPELDLTAYGDDEAEAKKEFDVVLKNYLEYAFKKGSLHHDLIAHGWTGGETSTTPIKPPSFDEMLNRNADFRAKLNLIGHPTLTSRSVQMPAGA